MTAALTIEQRELARHALGLPNRKKTSNRNHFVCGPGHSDYDNWMSMTENGCARRWASSMMTGGDNLFRLIRAGAELALNKGEKLDREDFPKVTIAA